MTPELEAIIAKVQTVSPEAAHYLRTQAASWATTIGAAFVWANTPHGHDYWGRLAAWVDCEHMKPPENPHEAFYRALTMPTACARLRTALASARSV